jgi:vancomycin permeability regulator SanA
MTRLRSIYESICRHRLASIFAALLVFALIVGPLSFTFLRTRGKRYDLGKSDISSVPYHKVTMVFGAGIYADGTPTPYLKWRVDTATKLYKAHRTDILLMTGDNRTTTHNEPAVMRDYALTLGVPRRAIVLDYAGFDTYDSCYRAKAIFGLHDALIVTQGYHLPRAMSTCRGVGVENDGVVAEHLARDFTISYILREVLSTDKMVTQLVLHARPEVLGTPHPIN